MEENKDTPAEPFPVQISHILPGTSTCYRVMGFNGEGGYGKVAKCFDMTAKKLVAVKILKGKHDCIWEMEMLKAISTLDPEKTNIVRFLDSFMFQSFSCLAFEMLDRSLWDLLNERRTSLNLNEIRPVMQQLFVAFDALKGIGIVHTDLKPDNVMLVNHKDQPFRVKLIDFGLARPVRKLWTGMTIQTYPYRAPELTLGLPLSEAADMWSVGCVMSFLYFCGDIFDEECDYYRLKAMIHLLGQPEDLLLSAGKYTGHFFSREGGGWGLKSPEEYKKATGKEPQVEWEFFQEMGTLEHEVKKFPEKTSAIEYDDRMAFLNLLKSILHMDPGKRLTPRQALEHPFITRAHLTDSILYANTGLELMAVTYSHSWDDSDNSPITEELIDDQASDSRAGASDTNSSSHEEAEPGAPKVSSDKEPSSHRFRTKVLKWFTDESSATETSTPGKSDTEGYSVINADIDTSSNHDAVLAIKCIFNGHSIQNSSGTDNITPSSSDSSGDSLPTPSSDGDWNSEPEGDTAPATEEDSGAAIPHNDSPTKTDSDDSEEAAAAPRPTDDNNTDKKKKKKNIFQRTCKLFRRVTMRLISVFKCHKN